MSPEMKAALLGILASAFSWVAYRLWRRLRFRRALPLGGVVTAHEPERLDVEVRGREEELVRLESALEEKSVVVIGGWAGIGKTTLGRAMASRLSWPQVGIWVKCKAGMGLDSLINALANYFRINYKDFAYIQKENLAVNPEQGIAAFVSALHRQQNVLFLDDFQLVDDPVVRTDLLQALRLRSGPARAIVLTREPDRLKEALRTEGAKQTYTEELPLGDLDRESALEVLRDCGLRERSEDELARLYKKTRGHPKGLELCAGQVKTGRPIEEIERVPLFERSGDEEKSLRRILKETESRLSRDELRLLRRCSVFDEPFDGSAVGYIFQTERWRGVAAGLEERLLLTRTDDQYELHSLLREYFYAGLKEARLVHGLAGQYYLHSVGEAVEEPEQLTLRLKAHYHFEMAQDHRQLIDLFWTVYHPLVMAGSWAEARRICELTLKASRKLQDRKAESSFLGALGNMCSRQGEWDKAIELYNQALKTMEQVGDIHGMAQTYTNLGSVYLQRGEWDKAIELYNQSLEIEEQVGNIHGMAQTYGNLGLVYADKGEWDKAIELYNQALKTMEQVGDIHGMAQTYTNLGSVYLQRGEWDKAIELYNQALKTMEQVGDIHGMAQTYTNLGSVYLQRGEWDKAIELYNQALKAMEQVGDIHGMGKTYNNLGLVYADKGEWDKAIELYKKDLEISERLGDIHGMGKTWGNLASLYESREDYATASGYIEKALQVFRKLGSFEVRKAEEQAARIEEKMAETREEES